MHFSFQLYKNLKSVIVQFKPTRWRGLHCGYQYQQISRKRNNTPQLESILSFRVRLAPEYRSHFVNKSGGC